MLGIGGAAAISALGNIGGSILGSIFSNNSAQEAYERQIEIAQNRHQWEVEDLKKAGLNPVLSANSGATVPSVQMSTSGQEISKGFQNLANSLALRSQESIINANNAKAQNDLASANFTNGAQTQEAYARIDKIESEINVNSVECGRIVAQTKNFNQLTAESQKKVEMYGQEIINLVESNKNLIKQGRAIDESAFASHSMGVSSLASAQVSMATANLVSKQATGQKLDNLEKAIIAKFSSEHPMLYTYAKTCKSPSAMVGVLAGSGIDLFNALAPLIKKLKR